MNAYFIAVIIGGGPGSDEQERERGTRVRTTEENLDVCAGGGHVFFDLILGDKADAAGPVLWGVVEDVVDGEAVGISGSEVVELFFEENVVHVDVGIDEGEFCPVCGVFEGSPDDLEHGGDASTAGDHANVTGEGRGVLEGALWAANLDLVAYFEQGDVAGDVALFVRLGRVQQEGESGTRKYLYQEVKVTKVIVAAGGGVAARNVLAVYLCRDGNVLPDG